MKLLKELICLTIFILLSALFAIAMAVAGFVCQYKKKCTVKDSTYECGLRPADGSRVSFDIKYFNYAILFLIFDIETIFLFPFAVFVGELGLFAIIEAFVFVALLLFGLFFAINKKMLRWI